MHTYLSLSLPTFERCSIAYLITHGSYVPYPTLQAPSLLQTVLGTIIFHLFSITLSNAN